MCTETGRLLKPHKLFTINALETKGVYYFREPIRNDMQKRFSYLSVIVCLMLGTSSCNEMGGKKSRGPIVLGDPATIITEADSQYLQDLVLDYHPTPQPAPEEIPATAAATETVPPPAENPQAQQPEQATKAEPAKEKGLEIDLGGVTIVITNISASGSGTAYMLKSGTINGQQIKVTEGSIDKIEQRYQAVVIVDNDLGMLVLDDVRTLTDWKAIKASGNSYTISGLEERKLQAPKITKASINKAVTRETRQRRMSKSLQQKWLSSVKNVRNANQKPLDLKLRSVMWKIDGKTAAGKPFNKQVRIDLPL
jgi:hypothetical protein